MGRQIGIVIKININMKASRYILFILISFGCRTTPEKSIDIVEAFNDLASNEFVKKFEQYDFSPMTQKQICILNQGISQHLNEINNWNLEVIDSFYVRNYPFPDLGTDFTFVSNKHGVIYFIYLPKLYPNATGDEKLYRNLNGEFILKDSIDLLFQKINSGMFDTFLENEMDAHASINDQFEQVVKLLPSTFPWMLRNGITYNVFMEKLKLEPKSNYEYIVKKVTPIVERNAHVSSWGKDYLLYDFEPHGFILIDFFREHKASESLKIDIFFIPKKIGYGMMFETDKKKYANCYK